MVYWIQLICLSVCRSKYAGAACFVLQNYHWCPSFCCHLKVPVISLTRILDAGSAPQTHIWYISFLYLCRTIPQTAWRTTSYAFCSICGSSAWSTRGRLVGDVYPISSGSAYVCLVQVAVMNIFVLKQINLSKPRHWEAFCPFFLHSHWSVLSPWPDWLHVGLLLSILSVRPSSC